MNDRPLQLALRQWRVQFSAPATPLIMGAVAALLAILGPFETGTYLSILPRFGYWLMLVVATYSVGLLVNTALDAALTGPLPLRVGVAGVATGLAVTPVVISLNYLVFAILPAPAQWPGLLAQFFAISLIISVIFQAIASAMPKPDTTAAPERAPALLDRMALDKRGPLVALSSEDHYTRIRTTQGEELILIRLSDAIREAAPTPGVKVHRSHWVALDQVTAARRDGDRAMLSITGGGDIPVSRANIAVIKDAGLLP